jgi:hypothetical protein
VREAGRCRADALLRSLAGAQHQAAALTDHFTRAGHLLDQLGHLLVTHAIQLREIGGVDH